jgi:hypothetical protein
VQRKPGWAIRPAMAASARCFSALTSPRKASVRCRLAAATGRPASGGKWSARQRTICRCIVGAIQWQKTAVSTQTYGGLGNDMRRCYNVRRLMLTLWSC